MDKMTLQPEKVNAAKKSSFFKPTIQKKLSVGSANDSYEAEADAVANKVMRMQEPQQNVSHTGALVQRKCAACEQEEKLRMKPLAETISPLIQRSPKENAGESQAPTHVENQINSSKGGGSSMDHSTKNFMENRFGTDFSDVKIHTGSQAVQMSRELNAQAFTVGNDIYFNEGKYSPNSESGKHLLAHELTHTVQQSGGIGRKVQKQAVAPAPRRTIWVNIGFDSSARANTETITKLHNSIAVERAAMASCCSSLHLGCDIDIRQHYDYNRDNKPAPADNDYDEDVAADRTLRQTNINNIDAPHGGIRILVTECTLSQTWQGTRIFPRANTGAEGVLWNRRLAANDTIAHESGHAAGYHGDIERNSHSSDPHNIMSPGSVRQANATPDTSWCTQMAATAI